MCVAIVVPKGANDPNREELLDAEYVNSDGLGMAWVHRGKVEYIKGISVDQCEMLIEQVKKPYILHFRLATAGGNDMAMCHPFPVDHFATPKLKGKASMVLFHNGHVSEWKEILLNMVISRRMKMLEGDVSDSRVCAVFAKKVGPDGLNLFDHNRFATLDGKGKVNLYGNAWDRHEGRIYSNKNHMWGERIRSHSTTPKRLAERYVVFTPKEKEEFNRDTPINRKGEGFKEYARIDKIVARNVQRASDMKQKMDARNSVESDWEREESIRRDAWDDGATHSRVSIAKTILSDPDDRPSEENFNRSCDMHHVFVYGCNNCETLNGITNYSKRDFEAPSKIVKRHVDETYIVPRRIKE